MKAMYRALLVAYIAALAVNSVRTQGTLSSFNGNYDGNYNLGKPPHTGTGTDMHPLITAVQFALMASNLDSDVQCDVQSSMEGP